ncbi:glycosyltransferase [Phytohalomonas tamaricis]|uniref:glycosyltransferase n=1 Tax=Phytohalomonas tamaricis TaxID=2081032 RepID=UPI000D0BBF14|nr:glycosyltransferase [Phytohalomonas tamaricis]
MLADAKASSSRVACIIPTRNGASELKRLLDSLALQSLSVTPLIVDSSSTDGTRELVEARGYKVLSIPQEQFNHGGTRQMMVDRFPDYDIYIFMTQDAYLDNDQALAELIDPFKDSTVGAVCGRQLPHENASLLARHARLFNYPAKSRVKALQDVPELGIKTAFMSNSFAAYRSEALQEVGGFPTYVILGEDVFVAASMLLSGWKVAYIAEACCRHSHNYSLIEEWRRYFDIGVFYHRESWINENFGAAGGEGLRFVRSELAYLGLRHFYLWPNALLRNAGKLLAYKASHKERFIPTAIKRLLSMNRRFWT